MRTLHDPVARPGLGTLSPRDTRAPDQSAATQNVLPPSRPTAILIALVIGTAGGWVAEILQLPLPWMIGAMGATTVAATFGLPIAMPAPIRTVMVTILGVMLGSTFSPEIMGQMAEWAVSLAMLVGYAAAAGGAGLLYFRRVCGYDPVTSYFAGMPGGLTEMVLVGSAMGGDPRIISLTHASRLLIVVFTLPFAFQILVGYEPADRPAAGLPLLEIAGPDLVILAACGMAGYFAARALKLPAAGVAGPMILSAAVHLAGWTAAKPPIELVAAAQVVVGCAVGARFTGATFRMIGRVAVAAAGGSAVLLGAMLAFAFGLHGVLGLPVEALALAYSPGGLAEMSLIALAIGTDAAFVATHHIVRIFLIVVFAPAVFRLLRRKT